jgi:hypothetical protein
MYHDYYSGPKKGNSNKDLNKNTPIQSRNSSQNPSLMLPLSEKVENSSGTEDVKNEAKCVLSDFSSDSAEGYFMGDRNNQLPFQNQSQRTGEDWSQSKSRLNSEA